MTAILAFNSVERFVISARTFSFTQSAIRAAAMCQTKKWITDVTQDGYVILTHDARIRSRPTERTAFEAAGARVFVFATKRPTPFVHLRALMIAWERVEDEVATTPPPYMFGIDADGVMNQYVPYDPAARPTSGIHRGRRRGNRQSRLDM